MRLFGLALLLWLATSCSTMRFVSPVATDSGLVPANAGPPASSPVSALPEEHRDLNQSPAPGGEIDEIHDEPHYGTLLLITTAAVAIYAAVVMLTHMTTN